ncbi:MAG TPA: hypothetical protein VIZ17_02840 [Acetobacteraceae bacterium]
MTEQAPLRLQLPTEAGFPHASMPTASAEELCAPAGGLDLQELVDAPRRTLETEYKGWRNLDNPEDQVEIARDVAAIANSGGGQILFGFNEATLAPIDTDPFGTVCTQEHVLRLTRRWLEPAPRCEVLAVRSSAGDLHPVIRIAGHGTVPVCARRSAPFVPESCRVSRGDVYIRRHRQPQRLGPPLIETGCIETAQEWAPLIRRCVRQDREAVLGMIEAVLEDRRPSRPLQQELTDWHIAARRAFLTLVPRSPWAERLARCHYALSYALELQSPDLLDHAQMPEFLRRCAFDAQKLFPAGQRMFDPPTRLAVRPRFVTDPAWNDGTDFLETAWLRAYPPTEVSDFWRVSPEGFVALVRGYGEDAADLNRALRRQPGTWVNPDLLARDLAELVIHARGLARFFPAPRRVLFRCDWWGLAGRELFDPAGNWPHSGTAIGDHRAVSMTVPLASLASAWPETVARLMAPVMRALEPDLLLGADWVRGQAVGWAR